MLSKKITLRVSLFIGEEEYERWAFPFDNAIANVIAKAKSLAIKESFLEAADEEKET